MSLSSALIRYMVAIAVGSLMGLYVLFLDRNYWSPDPMRLINVGLAVPGICAFYHTEPEVLSQFPWWFTTLLYDIQWHGHKYIVPAIALSVLVAFICERIFRHRSVNSPPRDET